LEEKTMKSKNNSENGQAIVLLVLSLVVLLGFTALALDGGMVYSDRRQAQNAADTAALAGGGAAGSVIEEKSLVWENWNRCSETLANAENAAVVRAAANSYDIFLSPDADGHNYVLAECFPDHMKVTVDILQDTQTSMAHVLFSGPLRNIVQAVAKVSPERSAFFGHSIVALKDTACSSSDGWGIELKGTSDVYLSGGGAYSYSCLYGNGTVDMIVNEGGISYVDSVVTPGTPVFDPNPTQVDEPLEVDVIDPPDCGYFGETIQPRPSDTTISPGRYESVRQVTGDLNLNPGLYCIENDFYFSGNNIIGEGVTIYSDQGSFTIMANADAILSAPTDETAGVPPAIPGVLIYMANGDVTMLGGATAIYTGTIYAPNGNVQIGGSSEADSEYNVQVIGWTVELHGTPGIGFVFNSQDNYRVPAKMDLYR
jgi:hypothetical protein